MRGELPTAMRPFPTSSMTHSQGPQAMDNSPCLWHNITDPRKREHLKLS